jgi:gas vesicle protein
MGQSAEELRRDIEYTREDLGETLDAIGDRVSPGRIMERRKNRVMYTWGNVRDRVMGTASDAGQSIGDSAGGAVDTIKGAPDAVAQQTQGNPMVAGAIAFGVGALLASVFPATSKEQQIADQLKEKAQPLAEDLKQSGQQMAEHLKEPAKEAIESVKETAQQGQQAVSDTAKDAADTTRQAAREGTEAVRGEGSGGSDGFAGQPI